MTGVCSAPAANQGVTNADTQTQHFAYFLNFTGAHQKLTITRRDQTSATAAMQHSTEHRGAGGWGTTGRERWRRRGSGARKSCFLDRSISNNYGMAWHGCWQGALWFTFVFAGVLPDVWCQCHSITVLSMDLLEQRVTGKQTLYGLTKKALQKEILFLSLFSNVTPVITSQPSIAEPKKNYLLI